MEYLSTGEQFEGTAETLVDLYVGESVFERMLLFVIEKASPHTHSQNEGQGGRGRGTTTRCVNFSRERDQCATLPLTIGALGPGYEAKCNNKAGKSDMI